MSLIYWVRHGENWANLSRELSHRVVDYPLTPRGRLQAAQTAEYFRSLEVDAVISSPLRRALETAAPIAAALGLPLRVMEEFRELNVGALERELPGRAAWDLHDHRLHAWLDRQEREIAFPEGEDFAGLMARMTRGLKQAARWERSIVVAHGGILYATLPDFVDGMDPRWTRDNDFNPNCAVTMLETSEHAGLLRLKVRAWAQIGHLNGDAAVRVSGVPKRAGKKRPALLYLCGPREHSARRLTELSQAHPGWFVLDSWAEDGLPEEEMRARAGSVEKWGMISLFMRIEQALRECNGAEGILLTGPARPEDLPRAAELFALEHCQAIS